MMAVDEDKVEEGVAPSPPSSYSLDCYPFTFSPLLLFAGAQYFDKGYSNYNSVAKFFETVLDVNMLENVLYERKNMLYEELLNLVTSRKMLVTCCIDAHFTAFQVLSERSLIYYDPLKPNLTLVHGSNCKKFASFLLLKCGYADSQHIQDNKDHYTGGESNQTRQMIYALWRDINKVQVAPRGSPVNLNLDRWLLFNNKANPRQMSTQLTGNTCYFQTYLFAVLCKVGCPVLASDGMSLDLQSVDKLAAASVAICRFLLEFFVQEGDAAPEAMEEEAALAAAMAGAAANSEEEEEAAAGAAGAALAGKGGRNGGGGGDARGVVLRPLTNNNFVLDFHRYREAKYYGMAMRYLHTLKLPVPDYERQYALTLAYYEGTRVLHTYGKFMLGGEMSSTLNTKSLQPVLGTDDSVYKLAQSNYYKYRAGTFMFGFNSGIMMRLRGFWEFNALRKNQLLAYYDELQPLIGGGGPALAATATHNRYREYYFMPQFEVGQQELVDVHHYTYAIDMVSATKDSKAEDKGMSAATRAVNHQLAEHIFFSTQRTANYDKMMSTEQFRASSKFFNYFSNHFLSTDWFDTFVAMGFQDFNPKEKDVNSLTQTVFYSQDMMSRQAYRMEYEFEKECINQMARSTLRKYQPRFVQQHYLQKYKANVRIGLGYTYSKYNTLMHFLNVVECYWQNPDLNSIHVFGKDIRALLGTACQKIFFEDGHSGYYHYGPLEVSAGQYRSDIDLAVTEYLGDVPPAVMREKRQLVNNLVVTERVYEFHHLKRVVARVLASAGGAKLKTDNTVLNLSLLSLMLDFGLFDEHAGLLHLPALQSLKEGRDKRQLQVEISNLIYESDKKNSVDSVTRAKVEELIFECSCKFMVNKNWSVQSKQFELIRQLNADPAYHQYVLLCKVYMSLCQINKSVEVDYYKVKCNGQFRIIIPLNFSKSTGDYLEQITRRYTFSERGGCIRYDDLALFDTRAPQPEINLFRVRFDSATEEQSMVKYIEFQNVFRALPGQQQEAAGGGQHQQYLIFIADNALTVEVDPTSGDGANPSSSSSSSSSSIDSGDDGSSSSSSSSSSEMVAGGGGLRGVAIRINRIVVEVATIFFNRAVSFVPCFKYADGEDVILFTSRNIHYLVDQGGQFCTDYYGMKHELMECISSEEIFVDLNDEHMFKSAKLNELVTESKTVLYFPDYLLQVASRQQLINLLDMAIYVRNVSFFILVLFYLNRSSVSLEFNHKSPDGKVEKISGPWLAAIKYVLGMVPNQHYDAIFSAQFFDLAAHDDLPLTDFIDVLCENFTKYQRQSDSGGYQIVPTAKQKAFLEKIVCAEECFHFSEVGSGKTKVILPLLCQLFLSNNAEAHAALARGGAPKDTLVILVPEHLVNDAKTQVFRYCLNLNFREEYRVYDDIFALLHEKVYLGGNGMQSKRYSHGGSKQAGHRSPMKQIFVTSFNQFKKALTYDSICRKVWPAREHILVVADEVDDFLDRDKLVFNICSNKANAFDRPTLERYFEVSRAVYRGARSLEPAVVQEAENPAYWAHLFDKCGAIHAEIQDASKSLNKSFGIFNEQALRHCSTNIAHDIEGYKSLIARPYESVNRAMPGSYYSDVERTVYLTYVILMEDIGKYDELFQQERKFISFEYWSEHVRSLDYDDLVYGHDPLSELVEKHPEVKDGLTRFLYEIVLRRMEIRDKSRSVNSIDVVFNFDCIGFTGTPFIDNYPTFSYLRGGREDAIPDMINRDFYAYSSDPIPAADFEKRFASFQGQNSNVLVEYVPSDFVTAAGDELEILEHLFLREEEQQLQQAVVNASAAAAAGAAAGSPSSSKPPSAQATAEGEGENGNWSASPPLSPQGSLSSLSSAHREQGGGGGRSSNGGGGRNGGGAAHDSRFQPGFNVLVDLCGIFKRSSIHQIRDLVVSHFGPDRFHYIYHIDQADSSDRILCCDSDNDVQFDEEFYKHLCEKYGAGLRDRVFFFVDNRNVIGKDIPFQLVFQRRYGVPMFRTSAVLAHDVDDFSKIWQAMGRSRTMNDTRFTIYKSGAPSAAAAATGARFQDIKQLALTRHLYVRNCDCKMAGNLSSIYQTLISLLNLSKRSFYYTDEIVNTFLEKMQMTIGDKVRRHERRLVTEVLGAPVPARIFAHILADKCQRSTRPAVAQGFGEGGGGGSAAAQEGGALVEELLCHIVRQKFEQREPTGGVLDEYIIFLSGEQESLMEISYTKQQQKQKQKQQNKNQDSDTMDVFDKRRQLPLSIEIDNYFEYTLDEGNDLTKAVLNQTIAVPILSLTYRLSGREHAINVYPTTQFLYSHHIQADYISDEVKDQAKAVVQPKALDFFMRSVTKVAAAQGGGGGGGGSSSSSGGGSGGGVEKLQIRVLENFIRQNPQYSLAALQKGVYVIGMKDQFNVHDLARLPLAPHISYVADEMGFILYDSQAGGGGGGGGGERAAMDEDGAEEAKKSGGKKSGGKKRRRSVDEFGPYFIEQYILMEVLSKQEVAVNVLDYYLNHRERLQRALDNYSEAQGKGFVCWRFLMNEAALANGAVDQAGAAGESGGAGGAGGAGGSGGGGGGGDGDSHMTDRGGAAGAGFSSVFPSNSPDTDPTFEMD